MEIVKAFGRLSGLQVQPAKSKIIFLNTATTCESYEGIPVLAHGETERYLGYAVGTGDTTEVNWAGRIRSVQRRLATAAQLGTSVENRVTILNVIMLPAVLFTAAVFDMPKWAEQQLRNIQKNFMWQHSTSTERARHKVNPGLLYTPKQAGGVGLASIEVACKTQKMKQAILWLTQRKDKYLAAWKMWVFRGATSGGSMVSPTPTKQKSGGTRKSTPGNDMHCLIGGWVSPGEGQAPVFSRLRQQQMQKAAIEANSWMVEDEWIIAFMEPIQGDVLQLEYEDSAFWPTYGWEDNPWVKDADGNVLTRKKYGNIKQCPMDQLCICRTSKQTYSMVIPWTSDQRYSSSKLKRWAVSILWSAQPLQIGEILKVPSKLKFRQQDRVKLDHQYEWKMMESGRIQGVLLGGENGGDIHIRLEQQLNGIYWKLATIQNHENKVRADILRLENVQEEGGIVFRAHPHLHGVIWKVADTVKNKHVVKAIKRQSFKQYKGEGTRLAPVIAALKAKAEGNEWVEAGMQQSPSELWAHRNELTDYQVWVAYRVATGQLNLFHCERVVDSSCRKTTDCDGTLETLGHIFWECPSAQKCWVKLIAQWTGERHDQESTKEYLGACARRKAPGIPNKARKMELNVYEPDEQEAMEHMWKRVWRIACSICITTLWSQRNRVIFEQEEISLDQAMQEFWSSCIRQLQAIAKRERRLPHTRITGTRLYLGTQLLQQTPGGIPSKVEIQEQQQQLMLLNRLQAFQTSCIRK
ncbi:LOW QUALITY PROTEIN: RxLR effector protein [Phytophthora megakarya]|uniref:RxLR effector protein n=1 Tax=Phytophthora megakarya TaxID=4795 RepID=A0A225WUR7_9STRA|nr:LOW QUALITY PROTEIN: RxLR effector protein [Phytophthora megakarya]